MEKIVVSREFGGRRVITVGKDSRSFWAKPISGKSWVVYHMGEVIATVDRVRLIELAVYNFVRAYEE